MRRSCEGLLDSTELVVVALKFYVENQKVALNMIWISPELEPYRPALDDLGG